MARIQPVEPNEATGKSKELLDAVQKKLGRVPNLLKTLANSPAALQSYLSQSDAFTHGVLTPKVREQIALAVAETNDCEYCLSAHSAIGKMVGLEDDEIVRSRQVTSDNRKVDALLKFATRIVKKRGFLTNEDLRDVREAGNSEAEVSEVVAVVVLNIYTNYFNHIAQTEIDFPKVDKLEKVS